MKNLEIKVNRNTSMVYLENTILGNDGENSQGDIIFSFVNDFVDGQARLEYEIEGQKRYLFLTKDEETYKAPIKSVLTKTGAINMQLVVTEGVSEEEIPIFKSNVFYVYCNNSLNAEIEQPEEYPNWIEIANTKLNSIDEALEKLNEFDLNAATKINEFNTNATSKTTAYNTNANSKTTAYNTNHTTSLKAYNDNASEKLSAYDTNALAKTNAFDTNASDKTTAFNSNATSKLNAYNSNATTKLNEYNSNADTRLQEFNDNAATFDERLIVVEETSQENKENIADNTNRVKRVENTLYDSGEANGTSINIKDSTLAEFQEITIDGVCEQETTDGKNLANDNDIKGTIIGGNKSIPNISVNENEVFSITLSQTLNEKGTGGTNNDYIAQHNLKWLDENENVISQSNFLMMTFSSVGKTKTLSNTGYVAPVGAKYLKLDVGSYFSNSCKLIHNYIQVEKGNVATEYEPYTGGQASPSPSYPQEIEVIDEGFEVKSSGLNRIGLHDVEETTKSDLTYSIKNGVLKLNGNATTMVPITRLLSSIPQETNKYRLEIFPISGSWTNGYLGIRGFDNGKQKWYSQVKHNYLSEIKEQKAEDIKNNTDTDLFVVQGSTFENFSCYVQFKKGAERADYEPYQGTSAPINLKGEFVGKINENAKDQVRLAFNEDDGQTNVKLGKKIRRKVFDGTEVLGIDNIYNGITQFSMSIGKLGKYTENQTSITIISNYYKGVAWHESWSKDNSIVIKGDKDCRIMTSQFSTVAEYKAHLKQLYDNGTPLIAYYELAEPYEVDLGVVDMPLSYSHETNVFTTHELQPNINAKYYRNFINTIQNLQVNEKALKEELVDINLRLSALETNLVNMASVEEVESEVVE